MQSAKNSSVNSGIYLARLMSPEEVKEATGITQIPSEIRNGWALCGDMPEGLWKVMQNQTERIGFRVSAFTTPNSRGYAIFTVQIRDYQIRFLLQMGWLKHTQFFETGARDGIYVSLGRDGGDHALVQKFHIQQHELEPLSAMSKLCLTADLNTELPELKLATQGAFATDTIPSAMPGQWVKHVTLNIVLP